MKAQTMSTDKIEIQFLTPVERLSLMILYRKRFTGLIIKTTGYFVAFLLIAECLTYVRIVTSPDFSRTAYEAGTLLAQHTFVDSWTFKISLGILITALFAIVHYYLKVNPFKADADANVKQMVQFIVAQKEYYSSTGQCFVRLSSDLSQHYELSPEEYALCQENGPIIMGLAPKSKYIFSLNDKAGSL